MKKILILMFVTFASLVALISCSKDDAAPTAAPVTPPANTSTFTSTPTVTPTPTITQTPTITSTPTITGTPICTFATTMTPIVETTDYGNFCNIASAFDLGSVPAGGEVVVTGTLNPATDTDQFLFAAVTAGTWTVLVDCYGNNDIMIQSTVWGPAPGCDYITGVAGAGDTRAYGVTLTAATQYFVYVTVVGDTRPASYRLILRSP